MVAMVFIFAVVIAILTAISVVVIAMALAVIVTPMIIRVGNIAAFNMRHVIVGFADGLAVRIVMVVVPRISNRFAMLFMPLFAPHRFAMLFAAIFHALAVSFFAFLVAFVRIVGVPAIMLMLPALRLVMLVSKAFPLAFHRLM